MISGLTGGSGGTNDGASFQHDFYQNDSNVGNTTTKDTTLFSVTERCSVEGKVRVGPECCVNPWFTFTFVNLKFLSTAQEMLLRISVEWKLENWKTEAEQSPGRETTVDPLTIDNRMRTPTEVCRRTVTRCVWLACCGHSRWTDGALPPDDKCVFGATMQELTVRE